MSAATTIDGSAARLTTPVQHRPPSKPVGISDFGTRNVDAHNAWIRPDHAPSSRGRGRRGVRTRLITLEPRERIELSTFSLRVKCSTD
jgi:hypothetical protein